MNPDAGGGSADGSNGGSPDGSGGSGGGHGGAGGSGGDSGGFGSQGPQLPPPGGGPNHQGSPLVMDLTGNGIDLYEVGEYGTFFDLRGNGQAVLTGWVQPEDGLLALPGENGTVDNITELFGNITTDGFSVLSAYDTNSDNVINSSDSIFDELRVWTDLNSLIATSLLPFSESHHSQPVNPYSMGLEPNLRSLISGYAFYIDFKFMV